MGKRRGETIPAMELGGRAQPLAEALIQGKGAALTPTDQLLAMASGAWVTQRIHVAAERGVADQLGGGEQSVESLGLFQETTPRQFARMLGEEHYLNWDDLLHSVRSGENAFRHRYGCSVFEWYQQQPQRAEIFDGAMGDFSRPETDALLATYDFAGGSHLVDVAGADAYRLKHILHDWAMTPVCRSWPRSAPAGGGPATADQSSSLASGIHQLPRGTGSAVGSAARETRSRTG